MFKKLILTGLILVFSSTSVIAAQKKLVVAHDATWPPMEYMDSKKRIIGYSVDYVDAIAKELGIEIVHVNVAWDGIFAGLLSKKYDFIASSVTITEERRKKMDFSIPYYEVRQAVVVPKTSNATKVEDFKGKAMGAQIGTTGYFAIQKIKGAQAKSYDDIPLAFEALYNGRIDAIVCDDPVAADFALQKEKYASTLKIAFIIESAEQEYYGFVTRKGNNEVLDLLNEGIAKVKAKGIEQNLRAKWIGK